MADRTVPDGSVQPAVQLLRWPDEALRRDELAGAGIPRLLLVPGDVAAPRVLMELEDWIRVPADERDLFVRIERLSRRVRRKPPPVLDELVLRNDTRWVAVAPTDARVMRPLLEHFGKVVSREVLVMSAWPDGIERSLNSRMSDLRPRLAAIGLRLLAARGRGYVLEHAGDDEHDGQDGHG
jgi:hypothetical protein